MSGEKILIVDDEKNMRLLIREILEDYNYVVAGEAEDGAEALAKYKQLKPDAVTLDVMMQGVDGITALADILAYDPKAKVIMVTAMYQKESITDLMEKGAVGYVTKPYQEEKLVAAIGKAVSGV